jgi:hypothetical protein
MLHVQLLMIYPIVTNQLRVTKVFLILGYKVTEVQKEALLSIN